MLHSQSCNLLGVTIRMCLPMPISVGYAGLMSCHCGGGSCDMYVMARMNSGRIGMRCQSQWMMDLINCRTWTNDCHNDAIISCIY